MSKRDCSEGFGHIMSVGNLIEFAAMWGMFGGFEFLGRNIHYMTSLVSFFYFLFVVSNSLFLK